MGDLAYDVAHLLAGGMVVASFLLLYQHRMSALINAFALHALLLTLAVLWQGFVQGAVSLYVTAAIAFLFKAVVVPIGLHRIVRRLDIHRSVEPVAGTGLNLLAGIGLVTLAILVMLPVTADAADFVRQDLIFALSVVLLGLLTMATRRNAVSQVVGFMSLENGLILAAAGARGMPFVVEITVALSVMVAFIVFGIFVFRIRERFDTVDVTALDRFRGERR